MNFEDRIKTILQNQSKLSDYKLECSSSVSRELFLIKDKIEINRGKHVKEYYLTVYVDFEEQGKKYKGSATLTLSPTLTDDEITKKVSDALFSASYVKTAWYPLPTPSSEKPELVSSEFTEANIAESVNAIAKTILEQGSEKAILNSAEVFLTVNNTRIINSKGIDVSYTKSENKIEVITSCQGKTEGVEVYGDAVYSSASLDKIASLVRDQLAETENRSIAEKASHIESIPVILRDKAVRNVFQFFEYQASGIAAFKKASKAELGKNFQGENVRGDLLTLTLKPALQNSASSCPYDGAGFLLKPTTIYEKGVVKHFAANVRFAHYLGIEPTGDLPCIEVAPGSLAYAEMLKKPHIEIITFSDFLCDSITGDFGGEFRLAKYFDGETVKIINNGAISANLFDVQKEFYFSKETTQYKNYLGPKAILIPGLKISG